MSGRSILAVLLGLVGGGIVVYAFITLGHVLFPVNEESMIEALASKDKEVLETFFKNLPLGNYISVILAHALGMLGGLIIGRLINRKELMHLIVITAIMLLAQVLNFLTVPHPSWFPVADLLTSLGLALGYIGYIYGKYRKA